MRIIFETKSMADRREKEVQRILLHPFRVIGILIPAQFLTLELE